MTPQPTTVNTGTAAAVPVLLTGVPYAYHDPELDQVVTTTAYTTRQPGLLIRSRDPQEGEDGAHWLIAHWQGEAVQGVTDYASPWIALVVADQLGALGVDWRRPGQALKEAGAPDGLWDALFPAALDARADDVLLTASTDGDHDDLARWDSHEPLMSLLAAGWNPEALTNRLLTEPDAATPLADRVAPLLQALAPLDGRPRWCGQCLPEARQSADERGWLTPCPRCHSAATQATGTEGRRS
ncbi:hypothetical protein ABZ897_59880 [Nonomuraea sp. NPDC046802]|uniref:hypothetical protein n=1 Tax=Nonomuraea sp. NPDC046802 TaxID=3154919 RepID=UPI00340D2A7C